jgi:CBS domain-containing protein
MNVEAVLKKRGTDIVTVAPGDTVVEVARLFGEKKSGIAIVCDSDSQVIGVVSLGDIVHAIGAKAADALGQSVETIMTKDPAVCAPGDDIEGALNTMEAMGIRHLPVVEEGRLKGFVEQRAALETLYEDAALDFAQLRSYVIKPSGRR